MVVAGPVGEDDMRVKLPNEACHGFTHLNRRDQLAITLIRDDVISADAQDLLDPLGLGQATRLQGLRLHRHVALVAIQKGDELDHGARGLEFKNGPPGADFAIIRMGTDHQDA